jgi:type I restriction enzyme M protein
LDGPVHDTDARKPIDQKRNAYMKSLGLTVLRIANQRLLDSTEQVLNEIAQSLSPSPYGRGTRVRVNGFRDRRGEILFIDTRKLGIMADRTHRELTDAEIARIARTYHTWRGSPSTSSPSTGEDRDGGEYRDVAGFCKSAPLDEIRKHGHVLTPGRYVGAEAQEDDGEPFEEKMQRLTATLREQQAEATKLDAAIAANLKGLGYGG